LYDISDFNKVGVANLAGNKNEDCFNKNNILELVAKSKESKVNHLKKTKFSIV